jgi:PAS domain S-box-containing protein
MRQAESDIMQAFSFDQGGTGARGVATTTRILLVEDSPTQAAEVASILEDAGFEVATAKDGVHGLECVRTSHFDLVLSDVLMPHMAGFELCRRIKDEFVGMPVILVTTLDGTSDILRGLECGADGYLNKPYEPEILVESINNLLAAKAQRTTTAETRPRHETVLAGQPFVLPAEADQVLDYLHSVFAHFSRREHHADEGAMQTAEALRRSEERFALAVAGANDGLWDWDLDNDSMYFSPRFLEILGSAAELRPHFDEWVRRVHPDDRARLEADLHAHLEGQSDYFVNEHRMQRNDGTYAWVLTRGASVRNGNGKAHRIAGSLTDMSQRRRAEEDLRNLGAQLNAVLNAFPDLCIRLAANDVVLACHGGRAGQLPIEASASIGKHPIDLFPPDIAARFSAATARARETAAVVSIECALPAGGRDRVWEVRLSPLPHGEVLALVRDLTAQK